MSTLQRLADRGLIQPPRWLPGNVQYETIMGSVAYGVSSDTSDLDVYGWAFPLKEDVFPHLRGEIPGFGRQAKRFEQFQEHHVHDRDALAGHGRTEPSSATISSGSWARSSRSCSRATSTSSATTNN